jgi:hypothetical protein
MNVSRDHPTASADKPADVPVGQIADFLSSPFRKKISVFT